MIEYAVLFVGVFIVVSGIVLAIINRSTVMVLPIIALGIICTVVGGTKGVQRWAFKLFGMETIIDMQDALRDDALDTASQIASLNQKIVQFEGEISRQEDVNKNIEEKFSEIDKKLTLSTSGKLPNITDVNKIVKENRNFTVLVFYKDNRKDDAASVRQKLLGAGFRASIINSDLSETTVSPQTINSNFIAITEKGKSKLEEVTKIVFQSVPAPRNKTINNGGPWDLRRGDIQVYLF